MRRAFARALAVATIALVTMLVAVSCGGDDKKAAKSTTTVTRFAPTVPFSNKQLAEGQGACGLVTPAEISAAVGLQPNPAAGVETTDGGSSCKWSLRATGTQFVTIFLVVSDTKGVEERVRAQDAGIENLAGVGDHAFFASNTAYVFKGPKLIIVSVTTTQASGVRKTATTKLAQSAAVRM